MSIEPGANVNFMATALGGHFGAGLLRADGLRLVETIQKHLATQWSAGVANPGQGQQSQQGGDEQRRAIRAAACLDGVAATLTQCRRVIEPAVEFAQTLSPVPQLASFSAAPVCSDYEALLFHGRAALDRLTLFISRAHGQQTDKFSKLRAVLSSFPNDHRALTALRQLDAVTFDGLLTGDDALRNRVAHRETINGNTTAVFNFLGVDSKKLLAFDCESLGHPVIRSSLAIARDTAFVVASCLALYLGMKSRVRPSDFSPKWRNPFIVASEWRDPLGRGPNLTIHAAMRPGGFTVNHEHYKTTIWGSAVALKDFKLP